MRPLTPRQAEILALIKDNIEATGMPPTRAEIARRLGFKSANAAEEHLKALAKKGLIEILAGTSRGIRVIPQADDEAAANDDGLPLIGQVAAGTPILAQEHVEAHYKVDPAMFRPSADFLLRVHGDSMKDIGILEGDLLAVHKTATAQNGQVVVARVGDDEVTVKRFEKNGKDVLLHAENEAYSPIKVDLGVENLAIEGLAVGIIRNGEWL
ncbi:MULTISPECIES: transcriptional repressor LexA [Corallincola]|uniref:LexA repressor n=3 Tax=Corallincola TaxID=1775176 RepID=A0A368NLX9_9GAMM|nr:MULTISPECIES: transcriptional repressor LexA [Corallincola]RCU51110.1 transcriptional repressor LexA [Corallincola holothuriorum]TAA46041.1 transcriptional repressor LexA [Corallincola spongiicola]TCI01406.1 transcriptional repressor LexA [Corallincola luteus]